MIIKRSKQAILAAIVSAAPVAQAQVAPTYSLFGTTDVFIQYYNTGAKSGVAVGSGGISNSMLGFRGSEDLGGGNKANFLLASYFAPDSGTLTGKMFELAMVGLSGDWGRFDLGRQNKPVSPVFGNGDPFRLSESMSPVLSMLLFPVGMGANVALPTSARGDSAVSYTTPVWNGTNAQLYYQFKNGASANADKSNQAAGMNIQHRSPVMYLGYSHYQAYNAGNRSTFADQYLTRFQTAGANYDLNIVKVYALWVREASDAPNTRRATISQLGARMPAGARGTLVGSLGYRVLSGSDQTSVSLGLGYDYALSKRTTLYSRATAIRNRHGAAVPITPAFFPAVAGATPRTFYVGMAHSF